MENGVLVIMTHTALFSADDQLKQLILDEFIERIEDTDIEYHFQNNHAHFDIVSQLISVSNEKQQIDEFLQKKLQ